MAKKSTARALVAEAPRMPRERRAEITQCKNGFIVCGGYDPKSGTQPKYIAKTEAEAKELASKLL